MKRPSDLYSFSYIELQKELHAAPRGYGGNGRKWAQWVILFADKYDCGSVLDYGCGQGTLKASLPNRLVCREYDPAIPGKDQPPSFADLVNVTDVLEHIEPDKLDNVLEHIRSLARKAVFAVIATRPANKVMSDGRNAHLIVEDREWWTTRLELVGFKVVPVEVKYKKPAREFVAVLEP